MAPELTKDASSRRWILTLPGAIHTTTAPDYALQRMSDGAFLTSAGTWATSHESLHAEDFEARDGKLRIRLPELSGDEFDSLEIYRFELEGENAFDCPLTFPEKPAAGSWDVREERGGVASMPEPEPVKPAPEPEVEPEPAVEPAPEPPVTPQTEEVIPPQPPVQPQGDPVEGPITMGVGEDGSEPKKSVWPKVLAGLLVIGLAAGGCWWFLTKKDASTKDMHPQTAPQLQRPEQQASSGPSLSQPAGQVRSLASARAYLRGEADAKQSLALAKPMRTATATSDEVDGAFLLLEDAAQKGEPEAMFLTATYYDPLSTLPRGTLMPDPAMALEWYSRAEAAGQAGAAAAKDAVLADLRTKAAAGDRLAAEILSRATSSK